MIIKKITTGFVIQQWNTERNCWVSQEFVAGEQCDYENTDGEPVDCGLMMNPVTQTEPYLPFEMVQP